MMILPAAVHGFRDAQKLCGATAGRTRTEKPLVYADPMRVRDYLEAAVL